MTEQDRTEGVEKRAAAVVWTPLHLANIRARANEINAGRRRRFNAYNQVGKAQLRLLAICEAEAEVEAAVIHLREAVRYAKRRGAVTTLRKAESLLRAIKGAVRNGEGHLGRAARQER